MSSVSASSPLPHDREVACYVLAYLARKGYSSTTSAFLQECSDLPPNTTMMVLPEVPLSTVVAEFRARKDSELLLSKLGARASWQALWDNLQHYMDQLRSLSSTLLDSHNELHPKKCTVRKKFQRLKPATQFPPPHRPPSTPPPPPQLTATPASPPHSSLTLPPLASTSSSPRKRREPQRLQLERYVDPLASSSAASSSSSSSEVPVLAPQQLVDVFLEDRDLQNKLAELINHSMTGSADGQLLTDDTLDSILNMVCTESLSSQHTTTTDDLSTLTNTLEEPIPEIQEPYEPEVKRSRNNDYN